MYKEQQKKKDEEIATLTKKVADLEAVNERMQEQMRLQKEQFQAEIAMRDEQIAEQKANLDRLENVVTKLNVKISE